MFFCFRNPLRPNNDENGISLYVITTSNIQVMRMKEVITKKNKSIDKFSLLVP